MTTKPIELTRDIDGDPMLSAAALSLLFGVDEELVNAHSKRSTVNNRTPMPTAWIRAGRRRTSEAAAATGSRDLLDVLAYWARRDRGAEIVFTDGGTR
ncbi:hypothetical protein A5649_09780 [Mycolicibacter heraklionensis]|uniref:Uncharacterized protein n=1 Tax=Mycolicibacter heraklionensis TaxID=512402 RepID=A0AA91EWH4_9MYCO|nr:hypothetical protein [Mycolicibacter heraklionensis]OBK82135.1 hypothetical protein A5649_09780 [Mycolicibacter heraklionensis]